MFMTTRASRRDCPGQNDLGMPPIVHRVPVSELSVGYSPRREGLDEEHVGALVEVVDELPPVLVEERAKTVVDGAHRLEAHRRAGRSHIGVVFFSGSEAEAMAVAVQANVRHGKPLSQLERQAAAVELMRRSPERSDRWVADVCGLSATTIGRLRRDAPGPVETVRPAQARPPSPAGAPGEDGPEHKSTASTEKSLRRAAKAAGVALSTAHRLARNSLGATRSSEVSAPVRPPGRTTDEGGPGTTGSTGAASDKPDVSGWLARTAVDPSDFNTYLCDLPMGRVKEIADECRHRAITWGEIADTLDRQSMIRAKTGQGPVS